MWQPSKLLVAGSNPVSARHRYDDLKRELALAWERILLVILAGGDVDAACERERRKEGIDLGA